MFLRNVCWLSTGYMALRPRRYDSLVKICCQPSSSELPNLPFVLLGIELQLKLFSVDLFFMCNPFITFVCPSLSLDTPSH
jgi:hypothetical protein